LYSPVLFENPLNTRWLYQESDLLDLAIKKYDIYKLAIFQLMTSGRKFYFD